MKQKKDRNLQIREMRERGTSQTEMAKTLGVSRQRIQQIERQLGFGPRTENGVLKTYEYSCAQCGKQSGARVKDRRFCSRECFYASREVKRTKQEEEALQQVRKEKARQRAQRYYYEVFKKKTDWQQIVKKRNTKS